MEQENFFNEELDFGVEGSQVDAKEFEAYMEGSTPPTAADPEKIKPASERDKQEEKEKGKAQSEDERIAALQAAKRKDEEDARKFIEGEEEGEEEEDNENDDASKSKTSKRNNDEYGNDDDESDNDFESLAKDLYKVGIFTPDGEDEEELPATSEEFIERFNYEKQKSAEQLVYQFASRHGEEYRDVFNAIFVKGADPIEYLSQFAQVERFKDMDLNDEDNQQKVVEAALRNQGWEDEDIRDEVKKLKLNADLDSTAQRHHKALVKSEEARLVKIEQESMARLERKKMIEQQYSESIRTVLAEKLKTQDFDGIPVNRDSANKAVDFLETKKWKLPSGELITDFDRVVMDLQHPQNHAAKVKLALLLMKGYEPGKAINLDLGPVAKKAVSKENNELFNFVKSKKIKSSNAPTDLKKKSQFLDGL
jgi:hypothetical protein